MRYEDEKYRKWLGTLPCVLCGNDITTEACHVKFSVASLGKVNPGNQKKTHDYWCVPLCGRHHREQHLGSERLFWVRQDRQPTKALAIALLLFAIFVSGSDYAEACRVIKAFKENA